MTFPRLTTYAISILVSAAAWWSLLGWDTTYTQGPDGAVMGPYSTLQVGSLVVVLGLLAVFLGHRGSTVAGPLLAALTLTVSFGIPAHHDETGLWGVGATMLLAGSFAAMWFVALLTRAFENRAGGLSCPR